MALAWHTFFLSKLKLEVILSLLATEEVERSSSNGDRIVQTSSSFLDADVDENADADENGVYVDKVSKLLVISLLELL